MEAGHEGGRPDSFRSALNRISDARWVVFVFAVVVAGLIVAEMVSIVAGIVLVASLLLVIALIRLRGRVARPARAAATLNEPIWPTTGIKLFAEALPDPCLILDRRGIARYANSRATDVIGIRPGDPLTARLRVPDLLSAFDRVSRGGGSEAVHFAERVPTERWFEAWFARLDLGASQGSFIVLILNDLTEQRRSEKVRADFVANASHEMRTPLASLVGFIDTLQGPAREDPVARERFLGVMEEQASRMSRLVDDLLSLSRIEMKAHVRPSGTANLNAVARHITDAMEPLAREMQVEISCVLPEEAVLVAGDQDELTQVVQNLVENACKYGQSGGRVLVEVAPGDSRDGPRLTVRDWGPGIAAEHIPRLTERFYRVDVQASRSHRGTGLGLAIVKHILTRHQARLSVESQIGSGAAFHVFFEQGIDFSSGSLDEKAVENQ